MGRRRRAEVRKLQPDLVYADTTVTALINKLMRDGKKNLSSRIFYGACRLIQERSGQEPLKVFRQALDNIRPRIEVRSRRVGGSTYQVPVEVIPRRSQSLSLRWLVAACDARPERTAVERVAGELLDAAAGRGGAVKKKEDVERMAEANRAYAHYRWSPRRVTAVLLRHRRHDNSYQYRPRAHAQHRHRCPHRCGQDDLDRAHLVLRRPHPQDG